LKTSPAPGAEAEADGSAADAKPGEEKPVVDVQVVHLRYAFEFVPPEADAAKVAERDLAEGEEAEDPAESPALVAKREFDSHIAEVVEGWKPGKQLTLTGIFRGGLFETKEELPAMCCPPPPISDEDYAADMELKKTLEAEIAALDLEDNDGKENR
jgi:hypothetical protein